jgi:putative two-component system response regulator
MSVADVYDALISRRVYKDGMSHEKAVSIISEGKGSHFDPDMVDAFVEIQEDFRAIAKRYGDSDDDMAKKKNQLDKFGTPVE